MSQTAAIPQIVIPTIPLRDFAPWAIFYGLFAALVVFFVSADQGALSIPSGMLIHEWVHDARHLLAYPCH